MQAAERERELARARSQRLKQAAQSLPGEPVSRGFAGRGALEGYLSHYSLVLQILYKEAPQPHCMKRVSDARNQVLFLVIMMTEVGHLT